MMQIAAHNLKVVLLQSVVLVVALAMILLADRKPAQALQLINKVQVRETAVGLVLADERGFTLYTYDRDTAGKPTCLDACAEAWPPLAARPGAEAKGNFGVVERPDGALQWMYKSKPLYKWTRDTVAGDVTGDRVDDVWSVARP